MNSLNDKQQVIFQDLGRMPYQQAWDYQQGLHNELKAKKLANRRLESTDPAFQPYAHHLLFCDHPPVYTLGKSGSMEHLLLNSEQLIEQGFEFYKINRGGDITYHGPGQIVGYPIFDLDCFFTDVHKYVRYLEEAVILTLKEYGLETIRIQGYTGVWLDETDYEPLRKICAIGVHMSRWVTLHGFAFNVQPDLDHFKNIIPCGIQEDDKAVTSLEQEIGKKVDIEEVKSILKGHFADLFEFEYMERSSKVV